MSCISKLQNHPDDLFPFFPGRAGFWVVFTFLMVFVGQSVVGQNPETITPDYDWLTSRDLGTAGINSTENLVISIDTDSNGLIYILTFGNGVFRYNPNSQSLSRIITDLPDSAGNLNGPLDLVIDNNDIIYIADSGSKLIKKFNTNGVLLGSLGSGFGGNGKNEFWEPTGLAIDNQNNLFIVDSYRGDNPQVTQKYFLKIYYNSGQFKSFQGTEEYPLIEPYRVAANDDYILISHAANNGEVLVFNKDLTYKKTLTDIGSPGSIVIDNFNFTHVIDYADKLDFTKILNYENLGFSEYLTLYNSINSGINSGVDFVIQVYDNKLNHRETINDKVGEDNIQLPLDLAFDKCSKFYINDGNIDGLSINFDLEIYNRTPSFDTENPVITCPADILRDVDPGKNYAVVSYASPTFSDNCSTPTLTQTGLVSGSQFPVGINDITFTATDSAGNTKTCTFTITVKPSEEVNMPPVFVNCPANIRKDNDPGFCGAKVTFETPIATDDKNNVTVTRIDLGPQSGDLFPVGTTTINFEANDGVNAPVSCSFTITVIDNEDPTITCPSDKTETVANGQTNKVVTYTLPVFNDNCPGSSIVKTAGLASGSNFPLGITNNTYVVTDASGNTAECSFTVTVTEDSDTEMPVINCPAAITINVDSGTCGAVANYTTPIATDNSGTPTVRFKSGLASGSVFPVGITEVIYEAEDAAGNKAECSFNITIIDNEDPTITCPSDKTETVANGQTNKVVTYTLPVFNDNCPGSSIAQTVGLVSGSLFPLGPTTNTFVVTDATGNTASCSFIVNITSGNPDLEIQCPGNKTEFLNENCQFQLPDYTKEAHVNLQANVTQSPPPGTIINLNTSVTIIAKRDEEVTTCTFMVNIVDNIPPIANCIAALDLRLNANGVATLNADSLDDNSYDACGIASKTLSKTSFTISELGENEVTLTVFDAAGNSDFCKTNVNILPYDPNVPDFNCKNSIIIELDENGAAQITPEDLYTGNGANYQFSIDRSNFTCDDKGSNQVFLSFISSNDSGSCTVEVIVKDLIGPTVRTKDITVALDATGRVSISPEMLDNGSTDNCGEISFSLNKKTFSCIDLGDNTVTLNVTDNSGNISSASVVITITGSCEVEPIPGVEHISIYPNPTPGPFTFTTPSGWSIDKVEVFDARGRYVLTETYSENQFEYSMDLRSVQQAVYILKLYTSEGIKIIRVIIY